MFEALDKLLESVRVLDARLSRLEQLHGYSDDKMMADRQATSELLMQAKGAIEREKGGVAAMMRSIQQIDDSKQQ